MNRTLLANLAAAAAALSAGGAVVATRMVVAETDPATLAFYRYLIAALCLAPVPLAMWRRAGVGARDVVAFMAFGALFFGFFPWAFTASLDHTTAARGAIGLATIPIQTLAVAVLFGRERLTAAKLASVALAFIGVTVAFGREALQPGQDTSFLGEGLMLAGAFSAAVYSVFSRPLLRRYGSLFVTAVTMLFGTLALALPAAAEGGLSHWPVLSVGGWWALAFLGVVAGAAQFTLFSWALQWLAPSRVVIYLTLVPVSAMALAVLILGEAVTAAMAAGLLLVVSGVFVANRPAPKAGAATGTATATQEP